jgi:hypothetical protein
VVRPGSDFEQVHDGEGTRGQLAAVDAGGYAPRADSARLVRGRRHEFPLIPPDRSYPRCQTRCSVTAKQRLVSRQVTRGWLVGLQVSPRIRDWGGSPWTGLRIGAFAGAGAPCPEGFLAGAFVPALILPEPGGHLKAARCAAAFSQGG